ncbi:MAG: glycosyltransferase [Patescibacteria group bacterium]
MSQQKKKILFFIPTLFYGGGERLVSELSLHLADSVESLIVLFEKKIAYPYEARLLSLDEPLSRNFFLRFYRLIPRFFKFRKIIKEEHPDGVITFGGAAALIALLLNTRPMVRVDSFPSQAKKGFWGFLYKLIARFLFHKAACVIVVSRAAGEDLEKHFGVPKEKIEVWYNPIDLEKIEQLSREPLEPSFEQLFSHPVVITMGRLSKEKAQWHLLEAFLRVKEGLPGTHLVILGEGEWEKILKELANELGIAELVHFLGWQTNPYKFLAKAKVFVLCSSWEGFPMSIVEAMACGLPVVSTDCTSGPREILAPSSSFRAQARDVEYGEYGILVPVGSSEFTGAMEPSLQEELFGKAILELLKNEHTSKMLKERAFLRAKDFDMKRFVERLEQRIV